jgi:hypothetical protein
MLKLLVRLAPALLELDAWRRVAVGLIRRALAPTAGADRAAFPLRLGERVVALLEAARVIADALLDVADGDAIDDGLHPGNATRDHHRVIRLLLAVDPSRELDRLLADAADVDRALGEDRIVAERLEDALLQCFVRHSFILQLVVVVLELAEVVGDDRGGQRFLLVASGAGAALHRLHESTEPADALSDQHADGESRGGAKQCGRERAPEGRLVVILKTQIWHSGKPVA